MFSTYAFPQVFPDKLSYQAIIRDDQGNILRDSFINIRIILFINETSLGEKTVYSETHRVRTNSDGIASLKIGDGDKPNVYKTLKLTDLDWEIPHMIKTELDLNNNGQYDIKRKGKLLSVPYAIYANTARKIIVVNNLSSHSSAVPLSANQGRILSERIQTKIHKNTIVDNLNSNDAKKVLSAAQGKVLKTEIGTKLNISDIADNLTTNNPNKALSANQGRILSRMIQTKIDKSKIINNLNSTNATEVLSAAQGKVLKTEIGTKLNISDIVDNLTTNNPNKALSANQGRILFGMIQTKIDKSKIINNLNSTNATEVLSAAQGKALKIEIDTKLNISDIVDDLVTNDPAKALSAAQGKKLNEKINKNNTLIKDPRGNLITKWSGNGSNGTSGGIGIENTFLGIRSGNAITTGGFNTAFGSESLKDNTIGTRNTSIGHASLHKSIDGEKNVAIGSYTLYNMITGNKNIAIGNEAGYYIADGLTFLQATNNSIFIGNNAKALADNSINEIVIGDDAIGRGNNTVVIGKEGSITSTHLGGILHSAGFNKRSKIMGGFTYNVGDVVFYDWVFYKRTGSAVTITSTTPTPPSDPNWEDISSDKLRKVGTNNLITKWSGRNSNGTSAGSGIENSFLGIMSGNAITTGKFNTAFGFKSLRDNTTGHRNTSIGSYSLAFNTIGAMNTSIGHSSLYNLVNGEKNVAIGSHPLYTMTTGNNNVAIGPLALYEITTGDNNIAIGNNAGYNIRNGTYLRVSNNSIFIGNDVNALNANSSNEIVIGNAATGKGNNTVVIGKEDSITSTHLGGILHSAGFNKRSKMSGFTYNVGDVVLYDGVFYKRTGSAITIPVTGPSPTPSSDPNWEDISSDKLLKIGRNNLIAKWSGKGSNGTNAGTGKENIFLGIMSGNAITSGDRNTAFGFKSFEDNTTGEKNTSFGAYSLADNDTGSRNTSIGYASLYKLASGRRNVAVGSHPLYEMTSGDDNTAIGTNALYKITTGDNNTTIGAYALHKITTGDNNTAIGTNALHKITTGDNNTAMGNKAGYYISNGSLLLTSNNSIFIGNNVKAEADNSSNEIVIGNDAKGKGDNTVTIGNSNITKTHLKGIVYANGVQLSSDKRIKSIISISDKESDLKKLLDIEITDYTMRDTDKMGNQHFKKVIAQQIEGIVPNIVEKNSGVIPSVYEFSKSVEIIDNMTSITTKKSHGFSKGDMVRLNLDDKREILVKVKEIKSANAFVVDLGDEVPPDKVFVYGKRVDDLRSVDYDGLTTLNISATQAVFNRIVDLEKESSIIKYENSILKQEVKVLKEGLSNSRKEIIKNLINILSKAKIIDVKDLKSLIEE
ncbi:hypothetical protein JBKA6_1075 [Ichthyobacterium seriolicida]|uniref:Peptidase S74 domain-containing protein n=2 Tax=Ichthyobacterium seriolicida TaxID=242600 RepID=A0A1J1EC53_9FLAO|nr:hypothetical protein JBKA6_1075 [Ichthyobacterium seriolicida]